MADVMPERMYKADDNHLCIEWRDGKRTTVSFKELRGSCPCAECVDELSGKRTFFPENVDDHIAPVEANPVGRYAYQFEWSDGHNTGLYTYEYLRSLSERPEPD